MRLRLLSLAGLLVLTACGKPAEKAPAASGVDAVAVAAAAPATRAAPAASDAAVDAAAGGAMTAEFADMVDCAGVYGALSGVDPAASPPPRDNPWFQSFSGIQMSIMTLPNSPGATAMSSGTTQRLAYWKAQPVAAQTARAEACKAQY